MGRVQHERTMRMLARRPAFRVSRLRADRSDGRAAIATLLVITLVLGFLVPATMAPTPAAATSPPSASLPPCVEHEDGTTTGACPRSSDQLRLDAAGGFGSVGATATTTMVPSMPACNSLDLPDGWSPALCYGEVSTVVTGTCGYVDLRDDRFKTGSCSSVLYQTPTTFEYSMESDRWDHPTVYPPPRPNCTAAPSFSVYYYGGDARYPHHMWSGRGPATLGCRITFEGPRPDGLYGPTWVLMRSSARIHTSGSSVGASASAEAFVPVDGDMRDFGPIARFSASEMSDDGEVTFTNESFHPTDEPMTFTWDFGDGATSTSSADEVSHTYTEPGDQTVTLTAKTGSLEHSTSRTVAITGPSLEVSVFFPDGESRKAAGEPFAVEVWVSALEDGVGSLSEVTLGDTPLQFPVDVLTIAESPPDATSVFALDRGDHRSFTWLLQPVAAGRVRISATATAVDGGGRELTDRGEANGRVGSAELEVEVVLDPSELELEERVGGEDDGPEPQDVTATITVRNTVDVPVEGVSFPTDLTLRSTDDSPIVVNRIEQTGGPFLAGGAGPVVFEDLTLAPAGEPGDTQAFDYTLQVLDDGRFEVEAGILFADQGGSTGMALGAAPLRATTDTLLGFELVPIGSPGVTVADDGFVTTDGGRMVRLSGWLRNLSSTETLEVDLASITPDREGEFLGAGAVIAMRPSDADLSLEQCYIGGPLTLAAGEAVQIHTGIVTSPEGGTRLGATWSLPDAIVLTEEGERPVEQSQIKTAPDPVAVAGMINTSVEMQEWSTTAFAHGMSAGFVDGSIEWVRSGYDGMAALLALATDWEALASGGMWLAKAQLSAVETYAQFWFMMTPQDKIDFVNDAALEVERLALAAGATVQDAESQRRAAEAVLPGWFDSVESAYANNDPQALGQAFGRVGGNVGLEVATCLMPAPKWKGRFQQLATEAGDEAAEAAATAGRLANAGATEAARQVARHSIPNGARVTSTTADSLWGLGTDAYNALRNFAADHDLLITLRDRTEGSIRRLAEGFIEKMEHMKLKNVRVDYDVPLGYLDSHADIVAFKRPIPADELAGVLAAIDDPTLRSAVASRHASRTKEWNRYRDLYASWEVNGFPSGFENTPNNALGGRDRTRLPFRLEPVVDPRTGEVIPDYFIPQVFKDGDWRGFTGDIDIMDIRHADGRSLDPATATQFYRMFADSPIQLRHGETLSWIQSSIGDVKGVFDIKVDQFRDFFKGGPDKMLQITPHDARVVQLDPTKTFVRTTSRETYAHFDGGWRHWYQPIRIGDYTIEFGQAGVNTVLPWRAPADWALNGADEDQDGLNDLGVCQPVADAADGAILRQDETGGVLEAFVNGVWTTFDASRCLAETGGGGALGDPTLRSMNTVTTAGTTPPAPVIAYAPQTALLEAASAGDTTLLTFDVPTLLGDDHVGDWFVVGDEVLIEPGSEREERHTVTGFGSLLLERPLQHDHPKDALVVLVEPAPRDDGGSGQGGDGDAGDGGGDGDVGDGGDDRGGDSGGAGDSDRDTDSDRDIEGAFAQGQVRSLEPACAGTGPSPFDDVLGSVHERGVACAARWRLIEGFSPGVFGPQHTLTRGQVATMLARLMGVAGADLPEDLADAFADDDANVHEPAINLLATMGVFHGVGPGRAAADEPISRGQLASMVERTLGTLGAELPAGTDRFNDLGTNPHRGAIERLGASGVVSGVGDGRFAPGRSTTRAQAATVFARALALLVEAGISLPPADSD